MRGSLVRVGAATVFISLTVAGPQIAVAYADDGTDSRSAHETHETAAGASSAPASPTPPRQRRAPRPAAAESTGRDGGSDRAARGDATPATTRPAARRSRVAEAPADSPPAAATRSTVPAARDAAVALATPPTTGPAPAPLAAASTPIRPVAAAGVAPAPVASNAVFTPRPAAAAASMRSIGGGLNQLLTSTANWLAQLPGGPITDLIEGAVYLVRRTLFPTSVGVVTKPIEVPLYLTDVSGGKNQKLGIYVTLGSDATPAIFELDTGGAGVYGAYASNKKENSDWWGDGVVTTSTPVQVLYDSGNSYTGYLATSQVSLWADGGTAPLLSTARVDVGQMDNITRDGKQLWTPEGLPQGVTTPPVDKAFYGDFGLAQQYAPNGISNVLAQLTYASGVKPGYRIHIDPAAKTAWLQIGLTDADLKDPSAYYFAEVIDPLAPSSARNPYSRLRYYGQQSFRANITVSTESDPATVILNSVDVGMTPDTGAATTLHNTNLAPLPLPYQWAGITSEQGDLKPGLNFSVSGTTTAGTQGQVFSFTTQPADTVPNLGVVEVQNDKPGNTNYYLNTGIYLFYLNDVVYNLGDSKGGGVIGLIPNRTQ